ncbi:H-type lectin domain-containing protein [Lignipirellula cremea]|uniref:Uncharacterized protein n=1 Tax=Lignipirellula cremea TaxID=2528010 RepID=A0A518DZG6_9BACT|nr:hypothetical protein [Lignipirellula cremea]QDU97201.1 hypothetical protein Pla8534_50460 [Lignipirellula cremea]
MSEDTPIEKPQSPGVSPRIVLLLVVLASFATAVLVLATCYFFAAENEGLTKQEGIFSPKARELPYEGHENFPSPYTSPPNVILLDYANRLSRDTAVTEVTTFGFQWKSSSDEHSSYLKWQAEGVSEFVSLPVFKALQEENVRLQGQVELLQKINQEK